MSQPLVLTYSTRGLSEKRAFVEWQAAMAPLFHVESARGRLFAPLGDWRRQIQERRLIAAHEALSDPLEPRGPAQFASDLGFGSAALLQPDAFHDASQAEICTPLPQIVSLNKRESFDPKFAHRTIDREQLRQIGQA